MPTWPTADGGPGQNRSLAPSGPSPIVGGTLGQSRFLANELPSSFVSNQLMTTADHISALTEDKSQFLPDGPMPTGGPKTSLATEQLRQREGVGGPQQDVHP